MTIHKVVIRPIITEKSMSAIDFKKYTPEVAHSAARIDVAHAVEELSKVKVAKMNTLHVHGHLRYQGRTQGYTAAWKKAVVSLIEDSKPIELSEDMM